MEYRSIARFNLYNFHRYWSSVFFCHRLFFYPCTLASLPFFLHFLCENPKVETWSRVCGGKIIMGFGRTCQKLCFSMYFCLVLTKCFRCLNGNATLDLLNVPLNNVTLGVGLHENALHRLYF